MDPITPLDVQIRLNHLRCFNPDEWDGAEPYLWTVFFKVDGDTARLVAEGGKVRMEGTATVVGTPGNQDSLPDGDVEAGDNVPIPAAIGQFKTRLKPLPLHGFNGAVMIPEAAGGFVGALAIALEEDGTPNASIAKGHQALNGAIQNALNSLIKTLAFDSLTPTKEEIEAKASAQVEVLKSQVLGAVTAAIKADVTIFDWLGGFGDMDDTIGNAVLRYSHDELAKNAIIPISVSWSSEGSWQITGDVQAKKAPHWQGWFGLGGQAKGGVGVVSPAPGTLDLYVRGLDDALWQKWWDGQKWAPSDSGWMRHNDGGVVTSTPTVLSTGPSNRDVYVRGKDGGVWHKFWNGTKWSGWFALGGQIKGDVGAVNPTPGTIDLYVRGLDDALWQKWWDGQKWGPSDSGWQRHDDGFKLASSPVVFSRGANHRHVFARAADGQVCHKFWNGTAWSPWFGLGGQVQGEVGACSPADGQIDLYARGLDDGLWQKWWDGQKWGPSDTGWHAHNDGLKLGSAPTVIAGPGFRDVYVRGADGQVYHKFWS